RRESELQKAGHSLGIRHVREKRHPVSHIFARPRGNPDLASCEVHCTLLASSSTLVLVAIQFTSQVLPQSSENACSKRHEFGVMSDQILRTRMFLPFQTLRTTVYGAARRVREVDIPLVSLGIIETKSENFEVACRAIGLHYPLIGTIPNFVDH